MPKIPLRPQIYKKVDQIEQFQTSQPLNQSEIYCDVVPLSHEMGIYGLFGFTYNALKRSNISAPSITFLLYQGPWKISYKNVGEGLQDQFQDIDIQVQCQDSEALSYLSYGLYNSGFPSAECVPNNEIPKQITNCANGEKVQNMLKGFRIGQFRDFTANGVKYLLLRFGAALVDDIIIVGWNNNNWIAALRDPLEYRYTGAEILIDENRLYSGLTLFDDKGLQVGIIIAIVLGSVGGVFLIIFLSYCCYPLICRSSRCERCRESIQQSCCSSKCCSCSCCCRSSTIEEYNDLPETKVNKLDSESEVSSDKPEGPPIYSLPSSQPTSYSATTDSNVNAEQQQSVTYPSSYTATPGRSYKQHPIKYPSSYPASVEPQPSAPADDTARTSYSVEDEVGDNSDNS
ncbi:MAG: hypothetical protein EZS28_013700 [Streblomastix strix]|uniref:Uncharacterized protein n=1 Tax=Streblomastix strix TaxID=222440 RepID=A0A5J4W771_9EUKA|nr:MAG: hypothetical protein EZS28_013700 [Streblomastix strix]